MHDDQKSDENNPYEAPSGLDSPAIVPTQLSVPLAIAMVVVLGSSFFLSVGLGIGLTLLALPAYARAVGRSSVRIAEGKNPTTIERVLTFFGSVVIVAVCAVAGGIAFFATCFSTVMVAESASAMNNDGLVILILVFSGAGFVLAAGLIYWACWPRKRRV